MHLTRDLGIAVLFLHRAPHRRAALPRCALPSDRRMGGTCIALALSALAFGAAHAFNPGATWVSTLAIALEAGVLLGSAFVVTRNLWFPIGVHFAMKFLEGPIYGTQVSGHVFLASLVTAHVTDRPRVADGGAFGPEPGVPAIATSLITSIALLAYASRNTLIVPFGRRRRGVRPS